MKHPKRALIVFIVLSIILLTGYLFPQDLIIPVQNANESSFNPHSFWCYPWGKSGVHKGIDIFASKGTNVIAPCSGIILRTGQNELGGNYILLLSGKWRLHYFAHLNTIYTEAGTLVRQGDGIASIGDTGNAKGKSPHLHYSIMSLIPCPWKIDASVQRYKKMFYIDPAREFKK